MGKQQLTSTTVLIPFLFPSLLRDDDTEQQQQHLCKSTMRVVMLELTPLMKLKSRNLSFPCTKNYLQRLIMAVVVVALCIFWEIFFGLQNTRIFRGICGAIFLSLSFFICNWDKRSQQQHLQNKFDILKRLLRHPKNALRARLCTHTHTHMRMCRKVEANVDEGATADQLVPVTQYMQCEQTYYRPSS